MLSEGLITELENTRRFFERSTGALEEGDSIYSPSAELYTAAQHVAHTAQTVLWFLEGAFGGKGFDVDFAKHDAETRKVTSLGAAREQLQHAFDEAVDLLGKKSDDELMTPFPANDPIMPGAPRLAIVGGIVDHTAHHRGALTVYARLLGKQPPMPYM